MIFMNETSIDLEMGACKYCIYDKIHNFRKNIPMYRGKFLLENGPWGVARVIMKWIAPSR